MGLFVIRNLLPIPEIPFMGAKLIIYLQTTKQKVEKLLN